MSLTDYKRKRDFSKTTEPSGKQAGKTKGGPRFVIQKHAASRLHYDFRLEAGGVLKSWAVPKGLPYKKGEKHLAVAVEDHPLDYAEFEGVIPEGEYGGGTVMLWDHGFYEAEDVEAGLRKGKLHVQLHGEKLEGEWALVRFKGGDKGNEWLVFKAGSGMRPLGKKRDDESVASGRSMKQIASDRDAVWNSSEIGEPSEGRRARPEFVSPMKAKLTETMPPPDEWLYEIKLDGYRAIALKDGKKTTLWSRNRKPLKFPDILEAVEKLPAKTVVLDGEIVALDDAGRPSFQLLQQRDEIEAPQAYYVFDLLNLQGKDLRELPIERRRELLQEVIGSGSDGLLRFSTELTGSAEAVMDGVRKMGLEGVIAKRRASKYETGRRSGTWRKVKCINEQEFVIGGFTPPGGTRKHFGAILIGYYKGKALKFAGRVGSGFSSSQLAALRKTFAKLEQKKTPFADVTEKHGRGALSKAELSRCTWLKPGLVCQVRFTEWTQEGSLRHPVFLGLRDDKSAAEVIRET